jgi:hypothetical protein
VSTLIGSPSRCQQYRAELAVILDCGFPSLAVVSLVNPFVEEIFKQFRLELHRTPGLEVIAQFYKPVVGFPAPAVKRLAEVDSLPAGVVAAKDAQQPLIRPALRLPAWPPGFRFLLFVESVGHDFAFLVPLFYKVNGGWECKAAQAGHHERYHRAAAKLWERYEAARRSPLLTATRERHKRQSRVSR